VAVTPDGKRTVSASYDHTLKIWDLDTGGELRTLKGHSGSVDAVAVTPDGQRAVSGSSDNTLKIWDLESCAILAEFTAEAPVHAVAVFPDGRTIVAGDALGRVHFLVVHGLKLA
jgi:WD40 repeat protein